MCTFGMTLKLNDDYSTTKMKSMKLSALKRDTKTTTNEKRKKKKLKAFNVTSIQFY